MLLGLDSYSVVLAISALTPLEEKAAARTPVRPFSTLHGMVLASNALQILALLVLSVLSMATVVPTALTHRPVPSTTACLCPLALLQEV